MALGVAMIGAILTTQTISHATSQIDNSSVLRREDRSHRRRA
jgi:hypothetical protein